MNELNVEKIKAREQVLFCETEEDAKACIKWLYNKGFVWNLVCEPPLTKDHTQWEIASQENVSEGIYYICDGNQIAWADYCDAEEHMESQKNYEIISFKSDLHKEINITFEELLALF